ncbi:MAG: hypothetical protein ACYDAZ_07880, partial [Thermoplasmataceae archaeon]
GKDRVAVHQGKGRQETVKVLYQIINRSRHYYLSTGMWHCHKYQRFIEAKDFKSWWVEEELA